MTFDEWWEANYADANFPGADRTFGEEVWNAAQAEAKATSVGKAPGTFKPAPSFQPPETCPECASGVPFGPDGHHVNRKEKRMLATTEAEKTLSQLEPIDTIKLAAAGFEMEATAVGKARVLLDELISDEVPVRSETVIVTPEQDEIVAEVSRRMHAVVDAAVEWHQSDTKDDWAEKHERLTNAIDSLLELRGRIVDTAIEKLDQQQSAERDVAD